MISPWTDGSPGRAATGPLGRRGSGQPHRQYQPLDLADFKDFGRRLGSDALQLNWYPGPVTVTAVYVPVFTPARLPPAG